jgi:large subunit ribosomal protein L2
MNNERIYQVLKGPVFSEKAQVLGETAGVQVFKVALDANKLEIKKAVEQLFGVEVVKVNTTITKGKTKRFGRTLGRRSDVKKAYVTLKAGQDVEMADLVEKVVHDHLHKGAPYAPLVEAKKRTGGRNNNGHITTRHVGGGHKQHYRIVDFKRNKDGIPAVVERIEYDPNRTSHIALLKYADGERRYIIAAKGLRAGDKVQSGNDAPIRPGNCLPLRNMPIGSTLHNIELKIGKGAQLVRSAGTSAQLLGRDGSYAIIRLRSGEMRKVHVECRAVLGEVSNSESNLRSLGKAGAARWRGVRPTVRGMAMNPVDHPHGGGEGRNKGIQPVSPWGQKAKGYKTRTNKRTTKMIIRDRRVK